MIPDHETVKQIMDATYNKFYLKWRKEQLTQDNVEQMMHEAYALKDKYDCSLCRAMIAELVVCIEEEYRRRRPC